MERIVGKKKQVHFYKEQIDRLAKISKRHGITESEAIRKMMDLGLDVYEEYSYIGLPQLADFVKRVKQKIRNSRAPKLI